MQQRKKVDSFATSGLTNVPITPPPVPARTQSPDAQALAAEWWRVEEMGSDFIRIRFNKNLREDKPWFCTYEIAGDIPTSHQGPTPAAAIAAAHEAWRKEQGK